jgi:hypothetical protein
VSSGSVEQSDTKAFLKIGETFAHRRGCYSHFLGGTIEVAFFNEELEKSNVGKLTHN